MSVFNFFKTNGPSGFGYSSTAEQVTEGLNLYGKTVLITGCNSGLGNVALRVLTMRGARVLALARSMEKAESCSKMYKGEIIPFACELSEPKSIRSCVESIKNTGINIDAIIGFAGIMALPELKQSHGYEMQFYTNHIGHFILITGLLDQLADNGRVIMISSDAHKLFVSKKGIDFENLSGEKEYKPFRAYGQSKLANLLFVKELACRFEGTNRVANAVHPGAVYTGIGRSLKIPLKKLLEPIVSLFLKSIPQGTATPLYAAVHPATANKNGEYFTNCNIARCGSIANDPMLSKKLWTVSENIANNK